VRLHLCLLEDLLCFDLGPTRRVLGFREGRRRQLICDLSRSLQDAAGLLADPVQRMLHGRLRRAADLELGDHAVDALDIGIDLATVVATHDRREGNVADVRGHVAQ